MRGFLQNALYISGTDRIIESNIWKIIIEVP